VSNSLRIGGPCGGVERRARGSAIGKVERRLEVEGRKVGLEGRRPTEATEATEETKMSPPSADDGLGGGGSTIMHRCLVIVITLKFESLVAAVIGLLLEPGHGAIVTQLQMLVALSLSGVFATLCRRHGKGLWLS
jgi:hypothetical protein